MMKSKRPRKALASIAALYALMLAGTPETAKAHGSGHGWKGAVAHGEAGFAGGRRYGNDAYTKAALNEREKLLDIKLKSICRGC